MDWPQSQVKLFRALLYCYPAEFRHEYGEEMEHVFASRLAHEPYWRLWLETGCDLAISALNEHLSILKSDLRHELRALRAIPGFTFLVLFVTALGIGAAVSVFSAVDAVLLRSLPYRHPENLVYLYTPNSHYTGLPSEIPPNVPDVCDWQRLSRTISSFAMFMPEGNSRLVQGGGVTPIATTSVSADFFKTLDVKPSLGRTFNANEDQPGHEFVAIVSHRLWLSQFKGSPDLPGEKIQLNRKTYTVIGIMAPDFGFPFDGDVPYLKIGSVQTDLWIPLAYSTAQKTDRSGHPAGAEVVGRLKAGATPDSVQSELNSIESRLNFLYAPEMQGWRVLVRPLQRVILGPVQQMLWTLLGVVGLVFLIAISNVSGLLLARTISRMQELSIRIALGAKRARIIRQLLTESLLLSCIGGALGIALACALVRVFIHLSPGGIPRFEQASVDIRILLVAVVLSIATGLSAAVLPAISASSLRLGPGKRVTTHPSRVFLIVVQIALAVVLLSGAGLLIRSYLNLQAVNPGFSPSVLTFQISLDEHYPTQKSHDIFYRSLLARLQSIPALGLVGASTEVPLTDDLGFAECEVEGYGQTPQLVQVFGATPEYREAIGTPLLRGRDFTPADVRTENVMINRKFSDAYFKGRDAIGGRIRLKGTLPRRGAVIGILADVRDQEMVAEAKPTLVQPAEVGDSFAVRANVPATEAASQIRSLVRSLDPALIPEIRTMRERIAIVNARQTFQTSVLSGFAFVAVVLALVGIYGLMSFTVAQRTAEIGIRLAIGSTRSSILTLILSHGMRLTFYGLSIGLAAAFALTRLVNSWLFQVKATDPLTFALTSIAIVGVACAACLGPAWNASRVDPIETLRQE